MIKKVTQETSLGWKEALPIALFHTYIAPKEQLGLSPYEMLYGRPFVYVSDLFLDPGAQSLQSYTMATGQFQQDIHSWGVNQDPKDSKKSPLYTPWIQVLIKVWKMGPQRLNSSLSSSTPGPLPCNTFERVTGRKARGLQTEETACKCQTFLSLLRGRKRKQTSNIFFLLYTNIKGGFS